MRELLQKRPFEPFEIRLSNGETYAIRHPEVALLLKTKIVIGDPETDRMTICALLHINSVHVLQSA